MKDLRCKDVMSKQLITLHPKDKVSTANNIFKKYYLHHIPICVDNEIVGILSVGDILAARNRYDSNSDKFPQQADFNFSFVEAVMTNRPITLTADDHLSTCLKLMQEKKINCVPISDNGKIAGIITTRDIIDLLSTALEA